MLGGRSRRSPGSSATAVRITAILTAVGFCLAAAAYGTTRYVGPDSDGGGDGPRPLRPRITEHPDRVTIETTARFDFSQPGRPARRARPGRPPRIECSLDDAPWQPCVGPVTLSGIGRGDHRFAVHAVNRAGDDGPAATFTWWRGRAATARRIDPALPAEERSHRPASAHPGPAPTRPRPEAPPMPPPPVEESGTPPAGPPFTIRQVGTLGPLFPGAPPETIGVSIANPNPHPIAVTSLTARIAVDPPGCPAAENFVLAPAAVSPAAPLVVGSESTLSLPEAGVAGPTIAMANLPYSQDDCEGDELDISLSGEAGR